jgi:plasmid stability protein
LTAGAIVAQIVVRNLEEEVKQRLKDRAAEHGRSAEEEAREILRSALLVEAEPAPPLGTRLLARFADAGLDEPIPELRGTPARPAEL